MFVGRTEGAVADRVGESSRIGEHAGQNAAAALVGFGAGSPHEFGHPREDSVERGVVFIVLGSVEFQCRRPIIGGAKRVCKMLDVQQRQGQAASPGRIGRCGCIADKRYSILGRRRNPAVSTIEFGEGPIHCASATQEAGIPVDWQQWTNSGILSFPERPRRPARPG